MAAESRQLPNSGTTLLDAAISAARTLQSTIQRGSEELLAQKQLESALVVGSKRELEATPATGTLPDDILDERIEEIKLLRDRVRDLESRLCESVASSSVPAATISAATEHLPADFDSSATGDLVSQALALVRKVEGASVTEQAAMLSTPCYLPSCLSAAPFNPEGVISSFQAAQSLAVAAIEELSAHGSSSSDSDAESRLAGLEAELKTQCTHFGVLMASVASTRSDLAAARAARMALLRHLPKATSSCATK